jgi:hypothetical protein
MNEVTDDEMKTLLAKLDADDNVVESMTTAPPDTSPPFELVPNTESTIVKLPSADSLRPDDARRVDTPATHVVHEVEVLPPEEPPIVDLRQQFEQMDAVTDEVLQAARADRQEAQDVITLCRLEIDKSINSNHNPARMFVDNLVKALEVKTTVNMTVVKIMEAKSKLLAATKAAATINNNTQVNNVNPTVGVDSSLIDILATPMGQEDED